MAVLVDIGLPDLSSANAGNISARDMIDHVSSFMMSFLIFSFGDLTSAR